MTNRQELERRLQRHTGGAGAMTKADVASFFGRGKDWVTSFLRGVEYVQVGPSKLYLVVDVAKRWMERRAI